MNKFKKGDKVTLRCLVDKSKSRFTVDHTRGDIVVMEEWGVFSNKPAEYHAWNLQNNVGPIKTTNV